MSQTLEERARSRRMPGATPEVALDAAAIRDAYRRWSSVYDLVFGGVSSAGRKRAADLVNRLPGRAVLEVGVGMGADYLEWLKAGAQATGLDLSSASLERAKQRCRLAGFAPDLRASDAEHLPFPDDTFDIVYSYGVMHHSPDTRQCIREAWRVLKPGGALRIMIYHDPSLTGFMLWLRYGFLRGKSLRQAVHDHLGFA